MLKGDYRWKRWSPGAYARDSPLVGAAAQPLAFAATARTSDSCQRGCGRAVLARLCADLGTVAAQQIARLRNSKRVRTDSASLLTQLDRSAQQRGLRQYITRMEPEGKDAVRVALDRVSFNTLIAWLADVQHQSGVRSDTATITAHTDAGIVSARLLLRATSP